MRLIEVENKLRNIFQSLKDQFSIPYHNYLEIIISSRLRSSNGHCECWRRNWTGEVESCKITMSRALLDEFGWERFEKTFRHEVAHLANACRGRRGHDESFKRICSEMGGAMNSKMAGLRYADCADNGYVKVVTKWIYTCPCGYQKKMSKRMSTKKRGNPGYFCGVCRKNHLDTWTEQRIA